MFQSASRALLRLSLIIGTGVFLTGHAEPMNTEHELLQNQAPSAVPTPASVIGWEPGSDRKITDTAHIAKYFQALAAAAPDRVVLTEIGKSYEGRALQLAIISSEQNIRQLAKYKDISRRLALGTGLTDDDARRLARDGKAVVLLDHGKDGNEPAAAEASLPLAYRLVTSEDDDVRNIRENVIVLITPCINPDGRETTLAWYRKILGTEHEMTARQPWLDHPMIGHEGNRDNIILVSPEMQALARVNWHEWNPQIVVDHHQGAAFPARIFVPPFQEPLNPDISPITNRGINLIGSAMGMRFEQEGKSGVVSRAGYTTWWNGSVDGSSTFHNQVGILVEVQQRPARWASPGVTAPESLPATFNNPRIPIGMVANAPSVFYPNPWLGGSWTYRDQMEYFVTASMGVLEVAARLKDVWLFNIYEVAKRHIEKGAKGDPFAYLIATNQEQWDAGEAIELVNALRRVGIRIHRASDAFTAGGKKYPAGTYVVYAAQAFRGELMNLLEPQRHPDLRATPGGDPIPPYDQAGWTLSIGMGVRTDRINQPFDARTVLQTEDATIEGGVRGQGPIYLLSTARNASFAALNQLWAAGVRVLRARSTFDAGGKTWPAGTFVVRTTAQTLTPIAASTGVEFIGAGEISIPVNAVNRPKVGVYQSYVVVDHNPDEGWIRWVFERYGYEYTTLKDADIRAGDLTGLSAIVLPDQAARDILHGYRPGSTLPEYVGGLGLEGAANLKRFVERGGTLLALSQAISFAVDQFGLPLRNAAENVPSAQLHVPGSYIRSAFDASHPLTFGMPPETGVMYYRRQAPQQLALEISPAAGKAVGVAATFPSGKLLLSGWEVGADRYLAGTPAVAQVGLGNGSVILVNFRPQFRDQARGTFKVLFNSILFSSTEKSARGTESQYAR